VRRVNYPGLMPALVVFAMISFAAVNCAAQKPSLELLDSKASASQTAISVVAQVKNISTSDISGVTVYCDFVNASGRIVRTEQSSFETDPLKPNSTSQFKCETKVSPDIKSFKYRFERMFGGPLIVKAPAKK